MLKDHHSRLLSFFQTEPTLKVNGVWVIRSLFCFTSHQRLRQIRNQIIYMLQTH